jgi:hypothetical protein
MRLLSTLTAALILGGCASIQITERNVVTEKVGQSPPIGTQASTPVGGAVFSQFRYWSKIGYRLDAPVNSPFMLGRVAAMEGDSLVKAVVDGKTAFCTVRRTYVDPVVGPHRTTCFIDAVGTGTFTKIAAAPGVVWLEKDLASPVGYSKSEQISPRSDSFKYELLYQGVSGTTIRLSYREFLDDLARPAYFQDVSYDIGTLPVTLTFKTVKLEVLSADDNALTYRVLSGF